MIRIPIIRGAQVSSLQQDSVYKMERERGLKKTIEAFMIIASFTTLNIAREGF